jgi:hypothetical protein
MTFLLCLHFIQSCCCGVDINFERSYEKLNSAHVKYSTRMCSVVIMVLPHEALLGIHSNAVHTYKSCFFMIHFIDILSTPKSAKVSEFRQCGTLNFAAIYWAIMKISVLEFINTLICCSLHVPYSFEAQLYRCYGTVSQLRSVSFTSEIVFAACLCSSTQSKIRISPARPYCDVPGFCVINGFWI